MKVVDILVDNKKDTQHKPHTINSTIEKHTDHSNCSHSSNNISNNKSD